MANVVDVKTINPFLVSTVSVIKMVSQLSSKIGRPVVKNTEFTDDSVLIVLGVTGELKGHVIFEIKEEKARMLAGKMMMGYEVTALDEMAISAISELGNMIMGNAATLFSRQKTIIDITTPTVARGNVAFSYMQRVVNICVPVMDISEAVLLHINISVEEKN